MAQYRIVKDTDIFTTVPTGSKMATVKVSLKQNEIYNGVDFFQGNDKYVDLTTPKGIVRTLMSTKTGEIAEPSFIEKVPETIIPTGFKKEVALTTENKKDTIFTPKNIIIGIVVLGGIYGILKWKKLI